MYGAAMSSLISKESFTFRPGSVVGFRLVLLIGAFRVVAQTLHLPGGFRPPHAQRGAAFAEHR
jgi:hypothetical protein